MSPAGYWPQLHAAIEAGADAVYFGLKHFTARAKVGFTLTELPDVMRTLHERGVKGYITFKTITFDFTRNRVGRFFFCHFASLLHGQCANHYIPLCDAQN